MGAIASVTRLFGRPSQQPRQATQDVYPSRHPESYVGWSRVVYDSPVVDTSETAAHPWPAYLEQGRRRLGWTVKQFCDATGVGRSTWYDWLSNGGSEKIPVETLVTIARAFGDHPVNAFIAATGLVEEKPQDREIGLILQSDLPDEEKQRQIALITRRREQDEERRISDTQELLRFHGERRAS